MKLTSVFLCSILLFSTACHKTVTAPVPGQLNTFDAYAFRVLSDAQAAINSFKTSVTSGSVAETPQIKTALNQAIQDYDLANAAYQAWRATGGTGSTTGLASQLNQIGTDISNVTALTGGK